MTYSIFNRTGLILISGVFAFALSLITILPVAAETTENTTGCNITPVVSTPLSQTGAPGQSLSFFAGVTNKNSAECGASDFTFETVDVPEGWSSVVWPPALSINPGNTTYIEIEYTSSAAAASGDYLLTLKTTQYDGANPYAEVLTNFTYTVEGEPQADPVDSTAPVVSILSPADGSIVKHKTTVNIQAQATDNVGVTNVTFKVNGVELCSGAALTSCDWQVPAGKGTYLISVDASDAAGNVGTKSVTVTSTNR